MSHPRVVAFVLAGGEGMRLRPFTLEQPKPALPFAGTHRIIDFALSNLYNSGIRSIFVLLQYKPRPLLDYLIKNWGFMNRERSSFMAPIEPAPHGLPGGGHFKGTADAVYRSLPLLDQLRPDVVAVFAADQVFRLDVRQMLAFHQAHAADATVAAVAVPIKQATGFGVIEAEADGRVTGFQEKPENPAPMSGDPTRAYASMGDYLFRSDMLREALHDAASRGEHDFGSHVLPRLIEKRRVYAYDLQRNCVPGLQPFEDPCYWRDVGTIDAYATAQRDVQGSRPRLCLDNPAWKIRPAEGERCEVC